MGKALILTVSLQLSMNAAVADELDKSTVNAAASRGGGPSEFSSVLVKFDNAVFSKLQKQALSREYDISIQNILLFGGGIIIRAVDCRAGTDTDVFYCKEAFWNAAPMGISVATQSTFIFNPKKNTERIEGCNCTELYFSKHPELAGKVAVMHIIPTSAHDLYPTEFSQEEVHSLKNLAAISIAELDSKEIGFYHQEMTDLLSRGPRTRDRIVFCRDTLLWRYPKLFAQIPPREEQLISRPFKPHFRWSSSPEPISPSGKP